MGDKWMLETGQDLSFLPEALQHEIGIHAAFQQFDGDFLLKLCVVPNGQMDRPHPATTQQAHKSIRSDPTIHHVDDGNNWSVARSRVGGHERPLDQGTLRDIARQEGVDFLPQGLISLAHVVKKSIALFRRNLDRLQKQSFDLTPTVSFHAESQSLGLASCSMCRRLIATAFKADHKKPGRPAPETLGAQNREWQRFAESNPAKWPGSFESRIGPQSSVSLSRLSFLPAVLPERGSIGPSPPGHRHDPVGDRGWRALALECDRQPPILRARHPAPDLDALYSGVRRPLRYRHD